jgi:AcrR family transcriptional regulator
MTADTHTETSSATARGKRGASEIERSYHRGNVAEDLVKAAIDILKTEKFENLSVRRLAREVGVSPRNFYNHFESLNDLIFTVAAKAFDRRAAASRRIIAKGKTRKQVVMEMAIDYVERAVREPQIFRIMYGQISSGSNHKLMGPSSVECFRLLVQAIYGEDRYRLEDLTWSLENCETAYSLFSLEYGLARNILEKHIRLRPDTPERRRQIVESIIGSFLDGSCANAFKNDKVR